MTLGISNEPIASFPGNGTHAPVSVSPGEAHLRRILDKMNAELKSKYRAGQAEHGGELWLKKGMLGAIKEELLDLIVYVYTLEEQLDGLVNGHMEDSHNG